MTLLLDKRRLREDLNHFCICGHVKLLHDGGDYEDFCLSTRMRISRCECDKYQRDNLKYLEGLVDKNV